MTQREGYAPMAMRFFFSNSGHRVIHSFIHSFFSFNAQPSVIKRT